MDGSESLRLARETADETRRLALELAEQRFSPPPDACSYCWAKDAASGWYPIYPDDDDCPQPPEPGDIYVTAGWAEGWYRPCGYCNPQRDSSPSGVAFETYEQRRDVALPAEPAKTMNQLLQELKSRR
jgi:hypothetical protein